MHTEVSIWGKDLIHANYFERPQKSDGFMDGKRYKWKYKC